MKFKVRRQNPGLECEIQGCDVEFSVETCNPMMRSEIQGWERKSRDEKWNLSCDVELSDLKIKFRVQR